MTGPKTTLDDFIRAADRSANEGIKSLIQVMHDHGGLLSNNKAFYQAVHLVAQAYGIDHASPARAWKALTDSEHANQVEAMRIVALIGGIYPPLPPKEAVNVNGQVIRRHFAF